MGANKLIYVSLLSPIPFPEYPPGYLSPLTYLGFWTRAREPRVVEASGKQYLVHLRRPYHPTCRASSWDSGNRDLVTTWFWVFPISSGTGHEKIFGFGTPVLLDGALRSTPKNPGVVDLVSEIFPREEIAAHQISGFPRRAPEPEVVQMSGIRR
ncbi:hypothetical protein EVAR_82184_1 [Eumeta japonica]|uniref:Uncharacterized protein n=1 Tax=Eumeta variegata TaxID=151549 RepID=A0A4C2ACZ4_EUMVA|nr:hypothetical protein EVAR_82184_1 [Eumeta japonica]